MKCYLTLLKRTKRGKEGKIQGLEIKEGKDLYQEKLLLIAWRLTVDYSKTKHKSTTSRF